MPSWVQLGANLRFKLGLCWVLVGQKYVLKHIWNTSYLQTLIFNRSCLSQAPHEPQKKMIFIGGVLKSEVCRYKQKVVPRALGPYFGNFWVQVGVQKSPKKGSKTQEWLHEESCVQRRGKVIYFSFGPIAISQSCRLPMASCKTAIA